MAYNIDYEELKLLINRKGGISECGRKISVHPDTLHLNLKNHNLKAGTLLAILNWTGANINTIVKDVDEIRQFNEPVAGYGRIQLLRNQADKIHLQLKNLLDEIENEKTTIAAAS